MDCSFPKSLRILKRSHFKWMCYGYKRFHGELMIVDFKRNSCNFTRLGITVTKKFGKSHQRNRFKRLVREAFRCHRSQLMAGYDINIRPKSAIQNIKIADIIHELLSSVGQNDYRTTFTGSSWPQS